MFWRATLGFISSLQFPRVSLPAMVPGANSPRSKGQDSSTNSICDDEEDIVKVFLIVKYQIDNYIPYLYLRLYTRASVARVRAKSAHLDNLIVFAFRVLFCSPFVVMIISH